MPTKLQTEIIAAAIAGFEEQKKRLNAQIAELRQMLSPVATDGNPPVPKKGRRMSLPRLARKLQRPNGRDGRNQDGRLKRLRQVRGPHEAETERGRKAIIEARKRVASETRQESKLTAGAAPELAAKRGRSPQRSGGGTRRERRRDGPR